MYSILNFETRERERERERGGERGRKKDWSLVNGKSNEGTKHNINGEEIRENKDIFERTFED